MRVTETRLPGVLHIDASPARDARGSFTRVFCTRDFAALGLGFTPRQSSLSHSPARGTLRGLHFQLPPSAETKLVTCVSGRVFDVTLDLRPDSPRYRSHVAVELAAQDGRSILIPPGCAHGVLTLSDDAVLLYQIDTDHDPQRACGARWNDQVFAIAWPFAPSVMSERDATWPDWLA